jgi:hypothetical protein
LDSNDVARLLSWDANDNIPVSNYERLWAHPAYLTAARTLGRRMLAAAAEDKALDGIVKDAGRYVATIWAFYLNATGGLTLPRLKEICTSSGMLSPGRARAVLLFLRYLGYVTPLASNDRREPVRYLPTQALTGTWRRIVRENLETARLIEPSIGFVSDRLNDAAVLDTYMRHYGAGMVVAAHARAGAGASAGVNDTLMRIFLHRHAGMQLIYWIVTSADPDDEFPPRKPVSLSIAAIARQLRVSRVHIKRILNEAAREGFLTLSDTGSVTLNESARDFIRYMISTNLLAFLICAAKTARDVPAPAPRAREHASIGAEP